MTFEEFILKVQPFKIDYENRKLHATRGGPGGLIPMVMECAKHVEPITEQSDIEKGLIGTFGSWSVWIPPVAMTDDQYKACVNAEVPA